MERQGCAWGLMAINVRNYLAASLAWERGGFDVRYGSARGSGEVALLICRLLVVYSRDRNPSSQGAGQGHPVARISGELYKLSGML